MRVILRSAGFFSFESCVWKQEATGQRKASVLLAPPPASSRPLWASCSEHYGRLQAPAAYTLWTVHESERSPTLTSVWPPLLCTCLKLSGIFFTSVGLGTTPLVAATMLAVNVSTNNRVLQGDICCISRSHYKIISHLSHQQVEVEARRANKAARPQFYSHLRMYVCKETCEHLVRYLSREDRHPDPWPAF